MSHVFREEKATQATAVLLRLADEEQLNRLKLIKLLYIAERESIKETGSPIIGDWYVAMKHGPVLSFTYDLLKGEEDARYWSEHIVNDDHNVRLRRDPGNHELSPYEIRKLTEVFERFRAASQWDLRDLTHSFKEWRENDPGSSSRAIPFKDVLAAVGRLDDLEELLLEQEEQEHFDQLFRRQAR